MKLLNKGIYILSFLLLSIPFACTEEEDFSIIAGLDFTVATLNADGTETGILPTTVPGDGRIVYTVDFGDPAFFHFINSETLLFKSSISEALVCSDTRMGYKHIKTRTNGLGIPVIRPGLHI